MILSLQGCMGVGKTTAAMYLQAHAPQIHVSLESNADVIEQVRQRRLNKSVYADYLEIQRLWLQSEVRRWVRVQVYPVTVMDFGAEEIEFYTLSYPQTIGQDWPAERALACELRALRRCMPDRILFLDASQETLRRRKAGDNTRSRTFFEHHMTHLLPLKRAWFFAKDNVDVLCTDGMSREEMGQAVLTWAQRCIGAQ